MDLKERSKQTVMTNRKYLIEQLQDGNFIDDSGASYEATIYYNIACPYQCDDKRALCHKKILIEKCVLNVKADG